MDPIKAHEDLLVLAAVMVAKANRNTMRNGTPGNRVMVDLGLMRRIADTVEAAQPGLVDRVRVQLREVRAARCDGCGRRGGELTENGCPSCGTDGTSR